MPTSDIEQVPITPKTYTFIFLSSFALLPPRVLTGAFGFCRAISSSDAFCDAACGRWNCEISPAIEWVSRHRGSHSCGWTVGTPTAQTLKAWWLCSGDLTFSSYRCRASTHKLIWVVGSFSSNRAVRSRPCCGRPNHHSSVYALICLYGRRNGW